MRTNISVESQLICTKPFWGVGEYIELWSCQICHKNFCQISNFSFWGGGPSNFGHVKSATKYFARFPTFDFVGVGVHWQIFLLFRSFHTEPAQNDPQWPILPPKWLRLAQNGQFWLNFNKNLNISAES